MLGSFVKTRRMLAATGILVVLLISPTPSTANDNVVVIEIDGQKSTGRITSWASEKLIVAEESSREIARPNIRSVSFDHPVRSSAGGQPMMIIFSNGDRISARPMSVSKDVLTVLWPLLEKMALTKIPLEKISAIIFELPASNSERWRLFADLETLPPGSDLILLTNGDRATGELKQFDSSFVELDASANLLKIDRSRVRAIRLNPELTNSTPTKGRRAIVTLTDGSRITATNVELTDGMLSVKSVGMGNLSLRLKAIASCQFFGERVIPLTDYQPAKVEFVPYLSGKWALVQNANVIHGPLSVRGTEYVTGLGMHSRMSVTYDLRGTEQAFQSVVGIDDAANGAGSVSFAIELDGRSVWTSSELSGKSPVTLAPEIKLQGSKQMTLTVNFGQFGDVSDYADWCEAVLILAP